MLQDFSRRDISFSSDRLPALEGLAQEVKRRHGYTYVAGLWKEDLINGLLWTAHQGTNSKALVRVVPSAVPSWSWASVEGPIKSWHQPGASSPREYASLHHKYPDEGLAGNPEFIDLDVTPEGTYLILRGLVKRIIMGKRFQTLNQFHRSNQFNLAQDPDSPHSYVQFDVETTEPPSEVWLLRFIHYRRLRRDTTEAMVLLPLDDRPDRYIRVGWASLDTWEFFQGVATVDVTIF